MIRRNHATATSEAIAYTPDNQVSGWGKGTADAAGAIASPTASQSWSLDSRGNWTGWTQNGTAQARTHSSANELTTLGTTSVTWDAAGNLTNDGTLTNIWGPRGLLDTAKQGTTIKGAYGYDALGRRSLKVVGALKTISIYDGWQCVWQKVTGSGTDTTKTYLYGNYIDEPVCLIRKWGTTSDTSYYLQGNNYNVEALTDRVGGIVERYAYSPYGAVTAYTGKGADGAWFTGDDVAAAGSARGNALTFQGRELDGETGNLYYRARYYSAGMGRFTGRDPYGYAAGDNNLYRFVFGNSINSVDPLGLWIRDPAKCAQILAKIISNSSLLTEQFMKYNPITDAAADFLVRNFGGTGLKPGNPGGHKIKIENLQSGLKRLVKEFKDHCMKDDCDDYPPPPPGVLDDAQELAYRPLPRASTYINLIGPLFPIIPPFPSFQAPQFGPTPLMGPGTMPPIFVGP